MKTLLSLLLLLGSAFTVYADYPAESYGADPSLPSNTLKIQAALDAAGIAGGGTVTVTKPGIYLLNTQGANPYDNGHKYCIEIRHNNLTLNIGQGVTLKLANGQQSTEPVDIIVFRGKRNLVFDGRGTITGNTSGQPWTHGYSQIVNGIIISGYGNTSGANHNITISNLTLTDHFSNPININSFAGITRNTDIRIKNVRTSGCGEGIQVIRADDVWIEDCFVDDPAYVSVGDAIEISGVTRFHIAGNTARNHSYGSGFDIFASQNGIVEDFIAENCANGIALHPSPGDVECENVLVQGGIIIPPPGTAFSDGIQLAGASLKNITVSNVKIQGTPHSIGIRGPGGDVSNSVGPIVIENCEVTGAGQGMFLGAFRDLTIRGGRYSNNVIDGIHLHYPAGLTSDDVKNLKIEGVTATDNGQHGIFINNQGFTVPPIVGSITNCQLEGNLHPIVAGPEGSGLTVENVTPNTISGGNNTSVFGVKQLCPTSDITAFQNPSKNQVLMITACGEPRLVIDARDGGSNIYLSRGSARLSEGETIVLRHENGKWLEFWHSIPIPMPKLPIR